MESLIEHVKIATAMYDKGLDLDLIKEFKINELTDLCNQISNFKIKKELYEGFKTIQREITRSTDSIQVLIKLHKAGINLLKIQNFIEILHNSGEKLSNYNYNKIIDVLQDDEMSEDVSYSYLKYFMDNIKSNVGKRTVVKNIKYYFTFNNDGLEKLTTDEIKLFTSPILSNYNLIPIKHCKKVYEILVQNIDLKKLILFLYLNKLDIQLEIEDYEKMNKNTKQIYEYIYDISKMINKEILYKLLLKWRDNGCSIYDLRILKSKIENNDEGVFEEIVKCRSSYINFIYGNKLSSMNLTDIEENKENLIIYAITNNKKSFLKLIEQNQEDFLRIPSSSILYDEKFYSKYLNINTLNNKDLKQLSFMNGRLMYINLLNEGTYTFNEIKTLYESSNGVYYKIYNNLLGLKIDERILRIKQIINSGLNMNKIADNEINNLSEKIEIKSLYNWIEQDFSHIKDLKSSDAVKILANYEDISRFIQDIQNRNELLYVLRNKELLYEKDSLQQVKKDIENIDRYWKKLIEEMQFSKEFIEKNHKNIQNFLLNNGSELAFEYYRSCNTTREKEAYKLIVKSELMGEFKKLKYHTNDLKREISFDLKDYQIEEWVNNNINLSNNSIEVGEYDDFYSTMILGEEPIKTCLSYKSGMYNRCLLACFDSNKKILYAKYNERIVARAMIRVTKGKYYNKKESISFIDVEKDNSYNINAEDEHSNSENLVIFLEKAYISGIPEKIENKVIEYFLNILKTKARSMKAMLVLSSFYQRYISNDFISTNYYIYISKSKAGKQYLDSLSGEALVSDEGQYKANTFLIWKKG